MRLLKRFTILKFLSLSSNTIDEPKHRITDDLLSKLDHVQRIHVNVQEMVRFAEAKNGAILSVNFLIFFSIYTGAVVQQTILRTTLYCASLGCLIASIVVLFYTFIPITGIQKQFNPVFFGSIGSKHIDIYVQSMCTLKTEHLIKFYCEQIHTNSQIASHKFKCFRIAVTLSLISFLGAVALVFW